MIQKKKPDAVWIQRLLIEMLGLTKFSRKSRNGYLEIKWMAPRWTEIKPHGQRS
jgi:hypothetical protein